MPEGYVTINSDATVRSSCVAIVCICYNHLGEALLARSKIFPRLSAFLVELLAISMAAGEAQFRNLDRVQFENDSLSLVASIGDSTLLFDEEVGGIFEAIREIAYFVHIMELSKSFTSS